ncbi:MAG: hypothetical protein ACOH14_07720 [Rhodoglobus sp.]
MAQKMTKDQQWKTVAEGLALGCLLLGVDTLTANKMRVQFAFAHAWRAWSRSSAFPSVSPRDFYIYVSKSSRRIGVSAAWNWGGELVPYLTIEGWDAVESLEVFAEAEMISAEDWQSLARSFIDELAE